MRRNTKVTSLLLMLAGYCVRVHFASVRVICCIHQNYTIRRIFENEYVLEDQSSACGHANHPLGNAE